VKHGSTRTSAPGTTGRLLHSPLIYDVLAWLLMRGREGAFRQKLVDLARLHASETVLDVACGTGTLAIAAKRRVGPGGSVHGIDASPEMIARATKKAKAGGVEVIFRNANVEALPYPDAHFDAVLSTLMLHHLPRQARQQCAREIRRVLKPGGRVLAVDFGEPHAKSGGLLAHFHRHGHVPLREIVATLSDAGLSVIESGAVGIKDLQFVLATNSDAGAAADRSSDERTEPIKAHGRAWVGAWAMVALATFVAAHGVILYYGLSHLGVSAIVVSSLVILVIVTHLGWLGFLRGLLRRRNRPR
jgi:ubiquinone/menaquinone biosynthesis C-methylase UbiE